MTYGTGPFGLGGLGVPIATAVAPAQTTLVSSRAIDGDTQRYLVDANGDPKGMDDLAQRVLLLMSFAVIESPFITAQALNDQRAAFAKALEPLTSGTTPAIEILSLDVTDAGADQVIRSLEFKNLLTNTKTSVTF